MTNTLPATVNQQHNLDFGNPTIAITTILVIGTCYCVTPYINAKYNRDTEISCGNFHLRCASSAPVNHESLTRT